MTQALPAQQLEGEIVDVHITSANIVVVTSQKLRIFDLAKGKVRWALEAITLGTKCDFRAARFGGKSCDSTLFVVLNSKDRKASYIQTYNITDWKLMKTKKVLFKPITAFSISY
jgi:hypothetical protein